MPEGHIGLKPPVRILIDTIAVYSKECAWRSFQYLSNRVSCLRVGTISNKEAQQVGVGPGHHLCEVEPLKISTTLGQKLHNSNSSPADGHPQVSRFGLKTIPEQNLNKAVKITVDGDTQRRAPNILMIVLRGFASL
jgi:hypothetical protein